MEEILAGYAEGLAVGVKDGKDPGTHLGFGLELLAEQCLGIGVGAEGEVCC